MRHYYILLFLYFTFNQHVGPTYCGTIANINELA